MVSQASVGAKKRSIPEVVSMVTLANLGQRIDLELLVNHLRNCVYEPSQYPAVFYSFKKPRITFSIFSSGKVLSYGGKKLEDIRVSFSKLISQIEPIDLKSKILPPRVCMIVSKVDLGRTVDIDDLATKLKGSIYEPEHFPGLMWRPSKGIIVILFSSGKCVITGAKSRRNLRDAYKRVRSKIGRFGKVRVSTS